MPAALCERTYAPTGPGQPPRCGFNHLRARRALSPRSLLKTQIYAGKIVLHTAKVILHNAKTTSHAAKSISQPAETT